MQHCLKLSGKGPVLQICKPWFRIPLGAGLYLILLFLSFPSLLNQVPHKGESQKLRCLPRNRTNKNRLGKKALHFLCLLLLKRYFWVKNWFTESNKGAKTESYWGERNLLTYLPNFFNSRLIRFPSHPSIEVVKNRCRHFLVEARTEATFQI